jgi:predicted short-subunit dehydrogenase-like oxidoreductase (DUF2520 family)
VRELERETSRAAGQSPEHFGIALAVIGAGRAGGSIAAAARAAGIEVRAAGRGDALEACRHSEAALLCVPDAAIGAAAAAIAGVVPPLRFVGHVSGAAGLDSLAVASGAGAETFSLHPLQTLPDARSDLTGAACAIGGSSDGATAFAESLAEALGMRPFALDEEARAAYHAAAAIASNFLVVLEESASELLDRLEIDDGRALLAPLVLRTAANWADRGPGALTGPIARGDEATVERHRAALGEHAPDLLPLYDELAERARRMAGSGTATGARAR